MKSTTSTTRNPERTMARRIRLLSRTAAALVSALSIAGLAAAGMQSSASAAPSSAPALAPVTSAPQAPRAGDPKHTKQWGEFCLYISSWRDSDSDCGDEATVNMYQGFYSMGARFGHHATCVSVNWMRDCEEDGWARVRSQRYATSVGLRVEDAEVCVRARVGNWWMHERCGDEDEWVYVNSGWRRLTGLRVTVDYDDHDNDDDDNDDDDDDNDHNGGHGFQGRH